MRTIFQFPPDGDININNTQVNKQQTGLEKEQAQIDGPQKPSFIIKQFDNINNQLNKNQRAQNNLKISQNNTINVLLIKNKKPKQHLTKPFINIKITPYFTN